MAGEGAGALAGRAAWADGSVLKGGGTKDDDRDFRVPCVRYGDLYTHRRFFITDCRARVAPETAATYTPLRDGDVLFAGSGETIDEFRRRRYGLWREEDFRLVEPWSAVSRWSRPDELAAVLSEAA